MNTINVNGAEIATDRVLLVFAKGALRMMSVGMKIRNTNLKSIKASLAAQGVVLKGKTAADCYNEVVSILG
jgi:predicted membrane protein